MPMLRMRLTGEAADAAALITTLHGLDGLDRVEEVVDQMSGMRDDSSSLDLSDDDVSGVHAIEVHAGNAKTVAEARDIVEMRAHELGVAVEFVERF
jgi:hypothetical protein